MTRILVHFQHRFDSDEAGATAVEYGLLIALIAAVIITAVVVLGGLLNTEFTSFNNDFTTAAT